MTLVWTVQGTAWDTRRRIVKKLTLHASLCIQAISMADVVCSFIVYQKTQVYRRQTGPTVVVYRSASWELFALSRFVQLALKLIYIVGIRTFFN